MIDTLDGIISSMCQKGPHTTEWSILKAELLISNGTIAMLPLSHSYLTCACLHLSGSQVSLKSTDSHYRQQRQRFSGPLQCRQRSHWFCYMRDPALHEGIQWYWELFETFWLPEIQLHKRCHLALPTKVSILLWSLFPTEDSFTVSKAAEGHLVRQSTKYFWRRVCSNFRCILVQQILTDKTVLTYSIEILR